MSNDISLKRSGKTLSVEILHRIAQDLPIVSCNVSANRSMSWQEACSAFLAVGLNRRYSTIILDATEYSTQLLEHIRSSPMIHPYVTSICLDLGRTPSTAVEANIFALRVSKTTPVLTNVSEICVCWGTLYKPSGYGRPAPYYPRSSVGLEVYADMLAQIWACFSHRLTRFTAHAYIDTLPVLAGLGKASELRHLEQISLHIYGGEWDEEYKDGILDTKLQEISQTMICSSASSLEHIDIQLVPCSAVQDVSVYKFFESLSNARSFPRLTKLEVQTSFLHGEERALSKMLSNCIHPGGSMALIIAPTFPQGWTCLRRDEGHEIDAVYTHLLSAWGHTWFPIQSLGLYIPRRNSKSAINSVLSSNPALQELDLINYYFKVRGLDAVLDVIPTSLRKLRISIQQVRPSVLDRLAARFPSLEHLDLKLRSTAPEGMNGRAKKFDEEEFNQQMSNRQYNHWSLRTASIIHDWSPGCVVNKPPPRYAISTANALSKAIKGLKIVDVRPLPRNLH